jgi:hypothetical protein
VLALEILVFAAEPAVYIFQTVFLAQKQPVLPLEGVFRALESTDYVFQMFILVFEVLFLVLEEPVSVTQFTVLAIEGRVRALETGVLALKKLLLFPERAQDAILTGE